MFDLKDYSANELESLMEKYPLTKEEADYILDYSISEVKFTDEIAFPGLLCIKRDGKFIIKIRKSDTEEEQKKSAIHELLHLDYNAGGCMNDENIFFVFEKETERIYKEHPRFVNYIFERVKNLSS